MTTQVYAPRGAINASPNAVGITSPTMIACRLEVIHGRLVAIHLDTGIRYRVGADLSVTLVPADSGADRVPA